MAFLLFSHLAAHLVLMVAEPGTDLMHLPLVALVLGMHGAAMLCFPTVIPVIVPMIIPMVVPMVVPVVIPMIVPVVVPMIVPVVILMVVPMIVPVVILMVVPTIVPVVILMVVPTIVPVIVSLIVPTVFPLLVLLVTALLILLVTALLILCRFHRRHRQRCIRNRDPRDIQCHPTAESQCQDLFARHDGPLLSSLIASYNRKI